MILYVLREKDSYGYEISKEIKNISEDKYSIKETTLYSAFTRLQKSDYIQSYPGKITNGKKRTYYSITPKGVSYYNEKCSEWTVVKEVVEHFVEKNDEK